MGYAQLWDEAILDNVMTEKSLARMKRGLLSRDDYKAVQAKTGVPLLFIIPVHEREASLSFNKHFHNGDPLSGRTFHVPAGRPKTGEPPFKWSDSAIDAVTMKNLHKVGNWSIERILYEQHRYNGITKYPSSYVLSGTQFYRGGMWIRDHVYDANTVDQRPGTLVMMKALISIDPSLRYFSREPFAPKDVVDGHKKAATKGGRILRNTAGSAGGIGAGTEITAKPSTTIQGIPVLPVGVGICAAVFTLAVVFVLVKGHFAKKEINNLWSGK